MQTLEAQHQAFSYVDDFIKLKNGTPQSNAPGNAPMPWSVKTLLE